MSFEIEASRSTILVPITPASKPEPLPVTNRWPKSLRTLGTRFSGDCRVSSLVSAVKNADFHEICVSLSNQCGL